MNDKAKHLQVKPAFNTQLNTPIKTLGAAIAISASILPNMAHASTYTVKYGDTLNKIASNYQTTAQALASANALDNPNLIVVGQNLTIPDAPTPQPPKESPKSETPNQATTQHTVAPGETLNYIAGLYHTNAQTLAKLNHIADINLIHIGQKLIISEGDAPTPQAPTTSEPTPEPKEIPATESTNPSTYKVVAGDTLRKIASRFKISLEDLLAANDVGNMNLIYVNQILNIPTPGNQVNLEEQPLAIPDTPSTSPQFGSANYYSAPQCTWFIKETFGTRVSNFWGDAKNWAYNAKKDGLKVDNTPTAYQSIAVFQPGVAYADPIYGHVGVVVGVSGNTVRIAETNYAGLGATVHYRDVPINSATYIHV